MGFLDGYEPVAARISRFWIEHAGKGRITTDLVKHGDGEVIIKAEVWVDQVLRATGYAHEVVTARGVNSTSAVENCETSAIGRALANFNYAPTGARPSREEMSKARPPSPHAQRVSALVERVKAAGMTEQVKGRYEWPWDASACDEIEAFLDGEPEAT